MYETKAIEMSELLSKVYNINNMGVYRSINAWAINSYQNCWASIVILCVCMYVYVCQIRVIVNH